MKIKGYKNLKNVFIIAIILILILFIIYSTSCKKETQKVELFTVQRGDIIESVSATGTVDATEIKNYGVREAAEILEIVEKDETFKKGDILLKIDNSRANLLLKQAEQNLKLAEQSIDIAKINYKQALNANHVAIQLAQASNKLAEQSTLNAYKSIEDANILAEASINAAYTAMQDANNYLAKVKASPLSTDLTIAQAESSVNAAEGAYEQAKESARAQTDAAEGAYEQALINQSITYWNNINSTQAAQTQINIMKKSIEQAETQLEISKINYELTKLNLKDYQIQAPFDGIVLNTNFTKGETAAPGVAAITIISNDFVIKSDINETDIAKLKINQEVEFTLDAYPDMGFKGKIIKISSISKNIAGIVTFEIKIKPEDKAKDYLK